MDRSLAIKSKKVRSQSLGAGLETDSTGFVHERLYRRLRDLILFGSLSRGSKLPSSRALAASMKVSRSTVLAAVDRLIADGYLEARRGSGVYVVYTGRVLQREGDVEAPSNPHPFVLGFATDTFPVDVWNRLQKRVWHDTSRVILRQVDRLGFRPLREQIAMHAAVTRGLACSYEQVIVTTCIPASIAFAARALGLADQTFWVENPCCQSSFGALPCNGIKTVPIDVDEEGLNVAAGIVAAPAASGALISAVRQAPTGVTLSAERRAMLASWAEAAEAWREVSGFGIIGIGVLATQLAVAVIGNVAGYPPSRQEKLPQHANLVMGVVNAIVFQAYKQVELGSRLEFFLVNVCGPCRPQFINQSVIKFAPIERLPALSGAAGRDDNKIREGIIGVHIGALRKFSAPHHEDAGRSLRDDCCASPVIENVVIRSEYAVPTKEHHVRSRINLEVGRFFQSGAFHEQMRPLQLDSGCCGPSGDLIPRVSGGKGGSVLRSARVAAVDFGLYRLAQFFDLISKGLPLKEGYEAASDTTQSQNESKTDDGTVGPFDPIVTMLAGLLLGGGLEGLGLYLYWGEYNRRQKRIGGTIAIIGSAVMCFLYCGPIMGWL